ncbi:hypothetical protein [Yinghuangia sp. YIM S10712]|uniref:hypothetical protein n=1 Tax=Yinghuangia sp. YIM S10712 TaxID=3436930 RepID=UPI003F53BE4B
MFEATAPHIRQNPAAPIRLAPALIAPSCAALVFESDEYDGEFDVRAWSYVVVTARHVQDLVRNLVPWAGDTDAQRLTAIDVCHQVAILLESDRERDAFLSEIAGRLGRSPSAAQRHHDARSR